MLVPFIHRKEVIHHSPEIRKGYIQYLILKDYMKKLVQSTLQKSPGK